MSSSFIQGRKDIWLNAPPSDAMRPQPSLLALVFNEVEWGDYVTARDAKLALWLWQMPQDYLAKFMRGPDFTHKCPPPRTETERQHEFMPALVGSVYEHLMSEHLVPEIRRELINRWETHFEHPDIRAGDWSMQTIFRRAFGDEAGELVSLHGHDLNQSINMLDSRAASCRAEGPEAQRYFQHGTILPSAMLTVGCVSVRSW